MRCYVSCFFCAEVDVFSQDYVAFFCDDNLCERVLTPVSVSLLLRQHLTTWWLLLWQSSVKYQQFFCPFSTLYLPSRSVFGFPFPALFRVPLLQWSLGRPCFSNFFSVWNKTREWDWRERQDSEVDWEEGRGDGCKTGWETEEEREPRRSQSRETGSSTSKLNLPLQQGLARH